MPTYDQLFKDVLEATFGEFLALFFPEEAGRLNLEQATFLDREFFTDVPEGERRHLDLVVEVPLRQEDGLKEVVLVHVEVQSRTEKDFPERMFRYFATLMLRHDRPILPIALFLHGGAPFIGLGEMRFEHRCLDRLICEFRFLKVGLRGLRSADYLDRGPLAAALSVLMKPGPLGPARLKAEALLRVARAKLDRAVTFLLSNLIETCLTLKGPEKIAYEELMKKSTYREAQRIEKTWADEIFEQGEARGEARGEAKGMLKILFAQIQLKFGPLPSGLEEQLAACSPEQLQEMSARVLTATTLAELLGE